MHANAERVAAALAAAAAQGVVRELETPCRTAAEAAAALGCDVGAIANSLVFMVGTQPVLVLASGGHRVDEARLSAVTGGAARRASAEEVRCHSGFPIGGVAPVGHPHPLTTIVDTALAAYPVIWAAAGTPHAIFPTSFDELLRVTGGRPAEIGVCSGVP